MYNFTVSRPANILDQIHLKCRMLSIKNSAPFVLLSPQDSLQIISYFNNGCINYTCFPCGLWSPIDILFSEGLSNVIEIDDLYPNFKKYINYFNFYLLTQLGNTTFTFLFKYHFYQLLLIGRPCSNRVQPSFRRTIAFRKQQYWYWCISQGYPGELTSHITCQERTYLTAMYHFKIKSSFRSVDHFGTQVKFMK